MDAPEQLRLFLALSVPEEVKNTIADVQSELRRACNDKACRWAARKQFHLTLRFLGNVSAQQVNELIEIIRAIGRSFSPLHLTAARMGFFPNSRFPRVLWVGVQERDGQLLPLQKALQLATQPFTQERAETDFTGHVTLARFNHLPRMQAEKLARAVSASETRVFGEWSSNQFEVMRSELSSQGARHTTLATLPLGGAESNQRLS